MTHDKTGGPALEYVHIDHALALVAAEREACAGVANKERKKSQEEINQLLAEGFGPKSAEDIWTGRLVASQDISKSIRARTNEDAQAALERVKQEARNEALREVYQNLRTYAPHHDPTTGPEHDIGYANGYHTAMARVQELITEDTDDE